VNDNNNNAVINTNRKLQDLILLFMATWKDLFEIYRQFGQAFSESYARPVLEHSYKKSILQIIRPPPAFMNELKQR
jgi:hypothetical protein